MSKPKTQPAAVVVNDDSTQLNILAALLDKAGIEARAYTGVEAALAAMDPADPPDLVVTDLYMPDIDGWRFCRLLRSPEYAAFNHLPILVVSATFAGDHPERIAADIGADAFLPVPVNGREFIAEVRTLLAGKEARRLSRALIVEDSKTLAGMLQKAFVAHGYHADTAFTVLDAEEAFSGTAYDLAVLDYHLPDGTGDKLLADFRALRPDCVCMMITTDPSPELALVWMKGGAAAYLRKPFKPEYLIEQCSRVRREQALLRVEHLLEQRTCQLHKSEERWRKLIQHSSDILAILDEDGITRYVSDSVEQITGFTPETFVGELSFQFVHPDDRKPIMEAFQQALRHPCVPVRAEYRHQRRDGGCVYLEAIGTNMLDDPDIHGIVLHVRDVTERRRSEEEQKKLQAQLTQAQKMESVGRLAGGVAHDFNNMLSVILGETELALMDLRRDDPLCRKLVHIQQSAQRSVRIVRQLLGFARRRPSRPGRST